jgi:hypothetical protein
MPDVIVVSAVVVCKLSGPFELAQAPARVPGMSVDSALGAGVYRRPEPHCTILAFPHGELVISGPQLPHTLLGVGEATAFLLGDGLSVASSKVENMVCDAKLVPSIDLERAAEAFGADARDSSLPEPRLEVPIPETGATAALYASGRVVITGAKDEEAINETIHRILDALELDVE